MLTYFACGTRYENANIVSIFLKQQGIGREALDFLGSNFKIAQTDNSIWRLQRRLAKKVGSEEGVKALMPCSSQVVAASFDNLNLDVTRHFGANGHVDLIAGIGYFLASLSTSKVALTAETSRSLDCDRDLDPDGAIIRKTWLRFRKQVFACMQEGEALQATSD